MRKIRLDVDALEVESFEVGGIDGAGTVRGHASDDGTCASMDLYAPEGCAGGGNTQVPCGGGATCSCQPQTCNGTCFHTCKFSCEGGLTCEYPYCLPQTDGC